jgi:hypothetical protein
LLAKGDVVNQVHLERIQNLHLIDPVVKPVYVLRRTVGDARKKGDLYEEPSHA